MPLQKRANSAPHVLATLFDSEERHQQRKRPVVGIRDPRRHACEALGGIQFAKCEMSYSPYSVERRKVRIMRAELSGAIEILQRIAGRTADDESETQCEIRLSKAWIDPNRPPPVMQSLPHIHA